MHAMGSSELAEAQTTTGVAGPEGAEATTMSLLDESTLQVYKERLHYNFEFLVECSATLASCHERLDTITDGTRICTKIVRMGRRSVREIEAALGYTMKQKADGTRAGDDAKREKPVAEVRDADPSSDGRRGRGRSLRSAGNLLG